jgi:replicative DNA helicase
MGVLKQHPHRKEKMYDAQLEQTLAKILFHNQDLLDAGLIEPSDFFTDTRDAITRMIKLRRNNNLLNETTVGRRFELPTDEEKAQFEELVFALKSLNKERKLKTLGGQITDIAVDNAPYTDKMMKIKQLVDSFESNTAKVDDYLIGRNVEQYKEKLFNKSVEDLLATGIYELDLKCGKGFKSGELIIVAGEPGGFKSTLIYNIALNVALRGEPVMLFTYEVSVDEVTEILASMLAGVNSIALRTRSYQPSDIAKLQKAFKTIESLPLHVIDTNARLNDIKLMGYQKKPKIILIDYLQIMPDITSDAVKSLEYVSRQLKLISNKQVLNCPIIAISQFSRPNNDKDGVKVERKMSDLKWSSCLSYDTLITLNDGSQMQIGDMYTNGIKELEIPTLDLDTNKLKIGKMTNCFYSGKRKLYTLKLKSGHTIKATAEHRFPTADGWKQLSELTVDDYIIVPRCINYDKPSIHSNELIEFVGYMIGDGSYLTHNTVKFTNGNLSIIEYVRKLAETEFKINPKIKKINSWYDLYLTNNGNNPIITKFKELGIHNQRGCDKSIPDDFFSMPDEKLKLFIKSIWKTDGSYGVCKNGNKFISYSTSSVTLVTQLQYILQKIGIITHISKVVKNNKFISYILYVTNDFQNDMIDILEINLTKVTDIRNQIDVIPSKFLRKFTKKFRFRNAGRLNVKRYGIPELYDNDIFWNKVKSIEEYGIEDTYDLTVDETHNFIANGIVVKNSLEQNAATVMFTDHVAKKTRTGIEDAIEINIVKNRHGIKAGLTVPIIPMYHRIDNSYVSKKEYKND